MLDHMLREKKIRRLGWQSQWVANIEFREVAIPPSGNLDAAGPKLYFPAALGVANVAHSAVHMLRQALRRGKHLKRRLAHAPLGKRVFLLLILFTGRSWSTLDDFVMNLPVIGAHYEAYFRPDTYHRQDQRLIYADLVATIVRAKVMEFCAAGGVEDPEFRTVSNPEQIISEKELARLTGREERDEGKRGGGGGREGGHGKGGKSG